MKWKILWILVLFILAVIFSHERDQDMPAKRIKIGGPFKGLNSDLPQTDTPLDYCYSMQNCHVNKSGQIEQRKGSWRGHTTSLNSLQEICNKIFEVKLPGQLNPSYILSSYGSFQEVYMISRPYVFYSVYTTGAPYFLPELSQVCQFSDWVIMTWGGGIPRKATVAAHVWTPSVISADAAMPQDSDSCFTFNNRLWLNSKANPMMAYGSKVGDPTASDSWSKTQDTVTIDFSKVLPMGDKLLGFHQFNGMLVFLFKKHIVLYSMPADFSSIRLVKIFNFGVYSKFSVCSVGSDLAVFGYDGITMLSQAYETGVASKYFTRNISKALIALNGSSLYSDNCTLFFYPPLRQLWAQVSNSGGSGITNFIIDLDLKECVGQYSFQIQSLMYTSVGIAQPYNLHGILRFSSTEVYLETLLDGTKDYLSSNSTGGYASSITAYFSKLKSIGGGRVKKFISGGVSIQNVTGSPAVTFGFGASGINYTSGDYSKRAISPITATAMSQCHISKNEVSTLINVNSVDVDYVVLGDKI